MSIHKTSKSGLFLLELMIIILFFAITGAICVRLFVAAHLADTQSGSLSRSMLEVQTAAEYVKEAGGDDARLCALLDAEPIGDGSVATFYDKDWNAVEADKTPAYTLSIRQQVGEDGMLTAQVAMEGESKIIIFELTVKQYLGVEGGAA